MKQIPFGHRVGAFLGRCFRPFSRLFCWWRTYTFADGTTYFLMPDSMAIFIALLAPALVYTPLYFINFPFTIGIILASPFALLSALRVKDGKVLCVRLFFVLPYWFTRIPPDSEFAIYEAWEDPQPSGVAFTLTHKVGEYLHLGTATTADALDRAIRHELLVQGWATVPGNSLALCRQ